MSSWYRRNLWQYKGNREYTRAGYEGARARFVEADLDVDCSDRHYMITGADCGLGLETAVEIARRGGILHLVCRDPTAMKEARTRIITTTGNDRIFQHQVDLSKPKDVTRWAEEFLKCYLSLDVIIHNAGCLVHERIVDEDGNELHFAVHILAVHIITTKLLPLLEKSKSPRVVMVSSSEMLKVRLDTRDPSFENIEPFDGLLVHSQTKRQQVVLNLVYAQLYPAIRFFSMHPGWADTPGLQQSLPHFYEMMKENLRTVLEGADTIIWLAISEAALKHPSGLFFQDRSPVATHLPLAWTRHSTTEEQEFMNLLDTFLSKYSSSSELSASNPPQEALPEESPGPAHVNNGKSVVIQESKEEVSCLRHEVTKDESRSNEKETSDKHPADIVDGKGAESAPKEGSELRDLQSEALHKQEKAEEQLRTSDHIHEDRSSRLSSTEEELQSLSCKYDSAQKQTKNSSLDCSDLNFESKTPQNTPTNEWDENIHHPDLLQNEKSQGQLQKQGNSSTSKIDGEDILVSQDQTSEDQGRADTSAKA